MNPETRVLHVPGGSSTHWLILPSRSFDQPASAFLMTVNKGIKSCNPGDRGADPGISIMGRTILLYALITRRHHQNIKITT